MPDVALDFLQTIVGVASGAATLKSLMDPSFISLRDDFAGAIKELQVASNRLEEKRKRSQKREGGYRRRDEPNEDDALEAPNDFREIPVVPTGLELLSKEQPFLRTNKVSGAYDDANHYLDVQFRLLREDFVRPLREGVQDFIHQYLSRKKKIPLGSIRIYPEVQIVSAQFVKDTTVFKVQLPERSYKRIRWDKSKRLLAGSLLLFTPSATAADLFRTIYFATVASIRNTKELQKGLVSIVWEGEGPKWDIDEEYVMVECEGYFESVRHTLQTLKILKLQEFPMYKFIVEASSDVKPPKYLRDAETPFKIQLLNGTEKEFSPLLDDSWPSAVELGLDESQFNAFKATITKQFAIVQGPPGTGKTFLGLKVVETLLRNRKLWKRKAVYEEIKALSSKSLEAEAPTTLQRRWELMVPILVVCYTNHALDQFMEGILDVILATDGDAAEKGADIVRVGGRSQSERLNDYLLHAVSRRKGANLALPPQYRANKYEVHRSIEEYQNKRSVLMDDLSGLRNLQGLINFWRLDIWGSLEKEYAPILWKNLASPSWLGLSYNMHNGGRGLIHTWFQVREVPPSTRIRKTYLNKDRGSGGQNKKANVEEDGHGSADEDEDYDVDELLSNRLLDDVYAEADFSSRSSQMHRDTRLPYYEIFSIYGCERAIASIEEKLDFLHNQNQDGQKSNSRNNKLDDMSIRKLEEEWNNLMNRIKFLDHLFSLYNAELLELPKDEAVIEWLKKAGLGEANFRNCEMSMRWAIYFFIVSQARTKTAEVARESGKKLMDLQQRLQQLQRYSDGVILRNSLVVGMTTTGAAKYNDLVRMMKSKIVVVEEAAEVLESHIVTSITRHCEHLILIGDHRQLRPSTTVYELATKFKLDISLFERMIRNNLNCYQLKKQHRMRPEIADLVVGTIYDELHNDHKVTLYPPVMGLTKNLFFLSHKEMEVSEEDSTSKSNLYEAEILGALCRYLVLQGYETDQITVLTAYMGQMFLLKKTMAAIPNCDGVRVTCVDNFQGEENDIILLSLVRSNAEEKVGFLNVDNRVCVSLSRAKHGLFIVGNMEMLSSKCKIWSQIKEKLQARDEIGESITLECQLHGTVTTAASDADFRLKAPQGGCPLICNVLLSCDHNCLSLCHPRDREHKEYKCELPCPKSCCNKEHPCVAKCFQDCPPCRTRVTRSLPRCPHIVEMNCYEDPLTYQCYVQVEKILPCKHIKEIACYINPEDFTCKEQVLKTLPCSHDKWMECHKDVKLGTCRLPVEKELPCGHKQNVECIHSLDVTKTKCETMVTKCLTDCGHTMELLCGDKDKFAKCTNLCSIRLDCGHQCRKVCHLEEDPDHQHYKCIKPCTKICEDPLGHKCQVQHLCSETCPPCKVKTLRTLACGHEKQLPCHEDIAKYECRQQCGRVMACTHGCQNQCYQACGPCKVKVDKTVPLCGHTITTQCSTAPEHNLCTKPVMPRTPSACGHLSLIPCRISATVTEKLRLEMCREPCKDLFQEELGGCTHYCKGTCGSCWQGRFHEKCQEKCGRTLVCGHVCAFPCAKFCPPCDKDCQTRCEHTKCSRKCGTPCVDCNEPCTWECSHLKCTKLCKEECDRPPCNEPCPETLKCGHPCIGFCGEECPVHCRI